MGLSKEEINLRKDLRRAKKWNELHQEIEGVDHKLCNKCNDYHPSTDEYFYINKNNSIDGLYPYCKKSAILSSCENQKTNKERSYKQHEKYRKSEKYKKWGRKHGLEQRKSGYSLNYQRNNKDRVYFYAALHRIHDITSIEWNKCLLFFEYKCAYCGITQEENKRNCNQKLQKDHVDHEGYNDLRNAVPACRRCNSSKHQSGVLNWYSQQPFYCIDRFRKLTTWITIEYQKYLEIKKDYKIVKTRNKREYILYVLDEKRNLGNVLGIGKHRKELVILAEDIFNDNEYITKPTN
ncbi:HNH endonuclease signature motif containing protein [Paenibacillus sp. O199]|uniref:HNH endonuclease n=1 Tax=Paenibacillus sp. O199 TaxID=1643925 RepID=UPI0007BF21C4|nr:HNH endonuclease signature motif containing protein [Paenibacillus sp. O199]